MCCSHDAFVAKLPELAFYDQSGGLPSSLFQNVVLGARLSVCHRSLLYQNFRCRGHLGKLFTLKAEGVKGLQ